MATAIKWQVCEPELDFQQEIQLWRASCARAREGMGWPKGPNGADLWNRAFGPIAFQDFGQTRTISTGFGVGMRNLLKPRKEEKEGGTPSFSSFLGWGKRLVGEQHRMGQQNVWK